MTHETAKLLNFQAMIWESWQIWLAVGLGLIVCEVFVPGFVLACLGLGCFGGAMAAHFKASIELQLVTSAVTALMTFFFLRPFALNIGFSGNERMSGVDALLGRECIITQAFDSSSGLGRCKVDGDDWRAELLERENADQATSGRIVVIDKVESNTLIVSLKSSSS